MKDIIDDVTELRTLVFEKLEQFKFVNLPFERGEILFSKGFFYLYGYSQTTR